MELVFGLEAVRSLVAANGATIMLLLLASRWVMSISGMIKRGTSEGKSVTINLIALMAYVAGAAHFVKEVGTGWVMEVTGFFFAVNIVLILLDTMLIVDYRGTPVAKSLLAIGGIVTVIAFMLGMIDLAGLAPVGEWESALAQEPPSQ